MQAELVKERERAKNEASARDSKIAGLFDELAAAQAEMQEARGKVDQVGMWWKEATGTSRMTSNTRNTSRLGSRLESEAWIPHGLRFAKTWLRRWHCLEARQEKYDAHACFATAEATSTR